MKTLFQQFYLVEIVATVLAGFAMAAILMQRAKGRLVPKPLTLFCIGVGVWASGHLAIFIGQPALVPLGQAIVNSSPIVTVFFLHFALWFRGYAAKRVIFFIYGTAIAVSFTGIFLEAGRYVHFDSLAIIVAGFSSIYWIAGYVCLLYKRRNVESKKRRQINAMAWAGVIGFISVSGFLISSPGVDLFPYPLFLFPFYVIALVYGVLIYEFMDINILAKKRVTWFFMILVLVGLTSLGLTALARIWSPGLASLPFWQVWLFFIALIFIIAGLHKPAIETATKLVYPMRKVNADILRGWEMTLAEAQGWRDLSKKASILLGDHLGFTVEVLASPSSSLPLNSSEPTIRCEKVDFEWKKNYSGWEDATPSVLHVVDVFASLLVSSCARLEQALKIAEREKEMLKEAHLAELGRFSASVAHELKIPMEIIGEESTKCEEVIKKEIESQLKRAQKLIDDLMTFSGKMNIKKEKLSVQETIKYAVAHYSRIGVEFDIDVSSGLYFNADFDKVTQVLFNLLNNATAVLKGKNDAIIVIHAAGDLEGIRINVMDNGPGVPPHIISDLFKPFVSGRPKGNGLGLAIARRIMEAHGGTIELSINKDWSSCFSLYFPIGGRR